MLRCHLILYNPLVRERQAELDAVDQRAPRSFDDVRRGPDGAPRVVAVGRVHQHAGE